MHYLLTHLDDAARLTVVHLRLSLVPVLIGLAIALPLGMLVQRRQFARRVTTAVASVVFTIPSLALFVVLPMIIGTRILDEANVMVALTAYTAALLVRAVLEALDAVPAQISDAATAVGYPRLTRMMKVELPLAVPVLIAGLRVVVVTNIAMVSVGSVIGIGGLGSWFTQGYQTGKSDQILAGIIALCALAVVVDGLIVLGGRLATPWAHAVRGGARRSVVAPVVGVPGELRAAGDRVSADCRQLDRPRRAGGPHPRASRVHRHRGGRLGADRRARRPAHRAHRPRHPAGGGRRQRLRALPTLGVLLFGTLLFGLGLGPSLVALMLLGVPALLAGTYAGIANVEPTVVDAARAMGMTESQVLLRVEVPNALPLILGGLRSATLQVVATATVAAYASLGGLGRYLIDGIKEREFHLALVGALTVAALALVLDGLLAVAVWASVPGTGRLRRTYRPLPHRLVGTSYGR